VKTKITISLGSNLGDSKKHLQEAVLSLLEHFSDAKYSMIYLTSPVDYADQNDFFNMILQATTQLPVENVFRLLREIEKKIGTDKTFSKGPRKIDLDLIFYGSLILTTEHLTLPHPRWKERLFVIEPILDLSPNEVDPENKEPIANLKKQNRFQDQKIQKLGLLFP
jgi:2-amino-4-hydroxy-6-hydroxymethyldihydropteridine diphosphokinase